MEPTPRMWLELTDGTNSKSVPVTGVGGRVRVAVGEPGRRSSIWTAVAGRGTSDVYFSSRTVMSVQKFSLHESGDWRFAFTQEYMHSDAGATVADRVVDRWPRPDPNDVGWVPGVSVWVRAEDVTPLDDADLKRPNQITWIPTPDPGEAAGIHLAYIVPDQGYTPMTGLNLVDVLALANGHGLAVLTTIRTPDSAELQRVADARLQAMTLVPEHAARQGEPGLRLGVFGNNPDGARWVWDTAF